MIKIKKATMLEIYSLCLALRVVKVMHAAVALLKKNVLWHVMRATSNTKIHLVV